jgi:hypothetical protein
MTTHTVDRRFMPTTSRPAPATLRRPALGAAAPIVRCALAAVLLGLALIALISGGPAVTVQYRIGHAAVVGTSGAPSAGAAQAATAKVAAVCSTIVHPWRERLHGRALGAGKAPASALLRPMAQQ